jgi:hypothetical protein
MIRGAHFSIIAIILAWACVSGAEPTEKREWTSTKGTKMVGVALKMNGKVVTFEREGGGEIKVPLDQLTENDQSILKKHFAEDEATAEAEHESPKDLPHPQGEVVGPIQAGDASYFLYLPKSLRDGRPAPLIFFTGAGGGNANQVRSYVEGAEINGWIVAASVESRNGVNGRPFVKACIDDIKATLPVDSERFYFTGGSGGGVFALINTATYDGAGTLPMIAHGVIDTMPSNKAHYYFVSGATDYNRCASAAMRKSYKDNAFHRFHEGGHSGGSPNIKHDGMAWLNGKYLAKHKSDSAYADELRDYEAAILNWARELSESEPHRALLHLEFLLNDYKASGPSADEAKKLRDKLSEDQSNVAYVEAIHAIDEFSQDELSGFGVGSIHKQTSKDIQKSAAKLAEKYQGIPEVPEILKNLQKPTG